ncbi:T9SS type A sorting domain-containing protein [Aquimarina sp. RZ0]|uniref:T9SS type A sorting domain-containing protein n=1 Tax=Aquimarina sp. RZ0 TaxID=2607730 RepID=UPI0011F306C9|nr:T9SS type A sorting domain-containing protein [Aquimarina sp. RZ0]KAA1244000.1 T9SS type A sorting domain-containing protein [Aquimarina sp. RZ0]
MKLIFTLLLSVLIQSTFAQSDGYGFINYQPENVPPGATSVTINFSSIIDDFPNNEAVGSIFFYIEEIDEEDLNVFGPIGTELGFFNFVLGEGAIDFTEAIPLNQGESFSDQLPSGRIYRIYAQGGIITDVNTNEQLGNMDAGDPMEIKVSTNIYESKIDLTILERSEQVLQSEDFIIKTRIDTEPLDIDEFGQIRFQIHEVDESDILKIGDVGSQVFVSQSESIFITSGIIDQDITITAPSVLSKDLPEGRTYRVRVLNEGSVRAAPFPYELKVIDETTLSVSDHSLSEPITIYPNPVINSIKIHGNLVVDVYKIYGLSGRLIKKMNNKESLDVSDLVPGIYFLLTDMGTARFVKR